MAKVSVTKSKLDSLANAVAAKSGESVPLTVDEMTTAVLSIDTDIEMQSKTITPTESSQTVTADNGYDGLSSVQVGAISSTYIGSEIVQRSSTDLSASGDTVTVPSGYYENEATKAVASGTAGTPTASKGTVLNNSVTVTPSVTNTTGYITGGTKIGTGINVSASELVSGTYNVISSGTKDVTNYASISVPSGSEGTPTATKGTVSNHAISVTPSVTNTGGYITGSAKTGTAVSVSASELVSGTYNVSASGTADVTNYENISVPSGTAGTPTATKGTASNGSITVTPSVTNTTGFITGSTKTGTTVTVSASELDSGTKSITANGTGIDVVGYATVDVNVSGGGASYDGIEVIYDSNGRVTDYVCHMENIPKFALNYVQWSRQPSDGVAEISFSTKPTHIGKGAFDHTKCQIDFSNLDELMYIGEAAFQSFRSNGYDGSSYVVNLPKFVGYYNATYSAASVFRATSNNNAYTPKIYNLPVCTIIPQYAWYQCSGSGWDVTIGSVGHAVTESKPQPFGGNTGITGTCTIYTTGDKVDTLNKAVQNGAGAGLTFVFKASEATTYGGTSYAAGATMLTA